MQTVMPIIPSTEPAIKSEFWIENVDDKMEEKSKATTDDRLEIVVNRAYMTPSLLLGQTITLYHKINEFKVKFSAYAIKTF